MTSEVVLGEREIPRVDSCRLEPCVVPEARAVQQTSLLRYLRTVLQTQLDDNGLDEDTE